MYFCDLTTASSIGGIAHAVAQALDVALAKMNVVDSLATTIKERGRCLLILDNFEQVARHAEETLGRWLNRASAARFLVTTREVLGLPGEEILALAPLASSDAAALFMRRAEAAKPGFQPTAEDQSAIDPLVKLLEGLPLAIELAAARVRVMPPRMLLLRMSERFKLLSSSGGRLDRQATLRAVFDWSWDLLSVPEKAALAQLSVFEGGFQLEAAEAILEICEVESTPSSIDALQSLVDKSLVERLEGDRFNILVTVRSYVVERLQRPGTDLNGSELLGAAKGRHRTYYAGRVESGALPFAFASSTTSSRRAGTRQGRATYRKRSRRWRTPGSP